MFGVFTQDHIHCVGVWQGYGSNLGIHAANQGIIVAFMRLVQ